VNRDSLLDVPYRPTERTEARKAAARERIVAAAMQLLAEGGYASAGVQAVAGRAGVATGTVYRHFASKDELFTEVFRRAAARELAAVERAAAGDRPVAERVAAGAEAFARRALAEPTRAYALLAEPVDAAIESERLRFRRGYRDAFARVLREGVDAGELAPHDSETVAAALVGALGEALVGPLSKRARDGHEALIATLINFSINAIPATRDPRPATPA
jgi:AcrR family transcriptional regulator